MAACHVSEYAVYCKHFPGPSPGWSQAVLDTVHVTFFDQSYVTSVEAMADNFVVGL